MSLVPAVPMAASAERERACRRSGPVERAASSRGSGIDSPGGWHYLSERRIAFRRRVDLQRVRDGQQATAELPLYVLPRAHLYSTGATRVVDHLISNP